MRTIHTRLVVLVSVVLLCVCFALLVIVAGEEYLALRVLLTPLLKGLPSRATDWRLLARWQAQSKERHLLIHGKNFSPSLFFNALAPEVSCPSEFRVGGVQDGGKWTCAPDASFPEKCTLLSLGISDNWSFEWEFQELKGNRCEIVSVDMNQQTQRTLDWFGKMGARALKATVKAHSNRTNGEISIVDLAKDAGWVSAGSATTIENRVEVLKIDIESSEYEVLPPALATITFCQILIEMHGRVVRQRDLLDKLSDAGYRLFHYEINAGGRNFDAVEYSLLHDSCLDKYGARRLGVFLSQRTTETAAN